ncbi:HNH endonuclease signature motif containing protein [Mycolicibacterium aurum]|uniref:HNH endonuclease signature motif containing protein n=1 Tax=Mycolicibacterium aurum TaxID=1791 RepID=UPI003556CE76
MPALEHRALARLTAETEPCRLGEKTWPAVLTTALRITSAEAKRRIARAKVLGPRRSFTGEPLAPLWESTAAAQARGEVDVAHVEVIERFHTALPSWVDVDTRAAADAQLAELAAGLDPDNLDAAARRLVACIDQDGAAPEERERERAAKRGVRIGKQQPDGTASISGWMTPETVAIWEALLAKEAAPGHNMPADENSGDDAGTGPGQQSESSPEQNTCRDTRTAAQRNHDAFLAIGRRALESGDLGTHNGLPVTVIVSTTLQELEKGAGVAVTGGGSLLPMPDLIRMAAHAHHYLYIYDQHTGQSLYLARTKRLASAAQRIVLHARDRGCTRPGCTAPGYWCEAHHAVTDWTNGGHTNIDDMTLACPQDHRMLDTTQWRTRKNTKNETEWLPPPDLDNGQHRVNGYHHPERYLLPEDDDGP